MACGFLIGFYLFPARHAKKNATVQIVCTAVLIFIMGAKLGLRPNFVQELAGLGLRSLVFSAVPIAASVLAVWLLSRRFLEREEKK